MATKRFEVSSFCIKKQVFQLKCDVAANCPSVAKFGFRQSQGSTPDDP